MVVLALLAITCIPRIGCFAAAGEECPPVGGLSFVCGPIAVEDLVRVPGTHWIIGSGMVQQNGPGRLHLIDSAKKAWEVFYPGPNPQNELDSKSYALCPGPPDGKTFGAHGIAITTTGTGSPRFSPSIMGARRSKFSKSTQQAQSRQSDGSAVWQWRKPFL
jgi:hypothetical protein